MPLRLFGRAGGRSARTASEVSLVALIVRQPYRQHCLASTGLQPFSTSSVIQRRSPVSQQATDIYAACRTCRPQAFEPRGALLVIVEVVRRVAVGVRDGGLNAVDDSDVVVGVASLLDFSD